MSIPAPSLINEIDMELMLLVMRGYTSSYSLWNYAQENKTEYIKPVAYKNVNQRFLRLARLGYIEEVKLGNNPHRRIDYKLKIKGLEQLIPYLLTHPNEIENIVKYMDKFELDKELFGFQLVENTETMLKLTRAFHEKAGIGLAGISTMDFDVRYFPEGFSETLEQDLAEAEAAGKVRKFTKQEPVKPSKKKKLTDVDDKEFLHEMKLSMAPSNTGKKVTKRSNVKELEMARNIAEIEATITELYENTRYLLRHHGIEIILERVRGRNKIILKRSVPQKGESVMRSPDELKIIIESANQSIDRMKEAFPLTTETILKLEEITYKINEFSLDKSVVVIEGITTTTKKQ